MSEVIPFEMPVIYAGQISQDQFLKIKRQVENYASDIVSQRSVIDSDKSREMMGHYSRALIFSLKPYQVNPELTIDQLRTHHAFVSDHFKALSTSIDHSISGRRIQNRAIAQALEDLLQWMEQACI